MKQRDEIREGGGKYLRESCDKEAESGKRKSHKEESWHLIQSPLKLRGRFQLYSVGLNWAVAGTICCII